MNALYQLTVQAALQVAIVTVVTLVGFALSVVPALALAALIVRLLLPCPEDGCWVGDGFGTLIIVGGLFGILGTAGGVLGFVYGMKITFWRSAIQNVPSAPQAFPTKT